MVNWKKYAEETTIHGFSELMRYNSMWFRVMWSLILIGMAVCFVWDSVRTVQTYMGEPRATKVDYVESDEMPVFAICTNDWMNPKKVEDLGITGADSILAKDILGLNPGVPGYMEAKQKFAKFMGPFCGSVKRPSPLHDFDQFNPFSVSAIQIPKVDESWKSLSANLELLRSVMYKPEELNITKTCKVCWNFANFPVETIVKDVGPCYLMRPGKVMKPSTRITAFPYIDITMRFPEGSYFSKYSEFFLYVADKATNPAGVENAALKPYAFNMVDVDLTQKHRVYFCNDSKDHVDNVCDAGCLRELEKECGADCMIYSGEIPEYLNTEKRVCNWMVDRMQFNRGCWTNASKTCALCKRRCHNTEALVRVTQSPLSGDPAMISMRIRFNNLFSTFEFVEYYSYPLTQLLGDFGGLLGLFLGASLISVSHAVYFCLVLPCNLGKKTEPE